MKLFISIIGIIAVSVWGYKSYERELHKRSLKNSPHVIEAEILRFSCGRKANIEFTVNGRVFNERIYVSQTECSELSASETIGVKVDDKGNVIFANDNYNDWSDAELVSIVLLCVAFIGLITYYGIISGKKKLKTKIPGL